MTQAILASENSTVQNENFSALSVFSNPAFGSLRVHTDVFGDLWFVAADVCEVLGLSNVSVALDNLDEDERSKFNLGRQGDVNIISEPGLYSLVLRSRKPEAKAFKRWITHEVIPSIRKRGLYATPDTLEKMISDPDTTIKLLQTIKAEREQRFALEAQARLDRPKVLFADAVDASQDSILIGDFAKILRQNGLNMGQNRLFDWLRDNRYLMNHGQSRNLPTQHSMELGLFEIKERTINSPDGTIRLVKTTRMTGKGQLYFAKKLLPGVELELGEACHE